VLPALIVWGLYFGFLKRYYKDIFATSASSDYFTKFFEGKASRRYPRVNLVVLGDSTSRASINPTDFRDLFAVNLGVNGGTALSAYYILERYVREHRAPDCVLYVSQYNWKRNYTYFFGKVVFDGSLDWPAIHHAWKAGADNGVFPATEYSHLGFLLKAARTDLMIEELPLNLMQEFILGKFPLRRKKAKMMRQSSIRNRGFQNNNIKKVLPEDRFFNEGHADFLQPFEAYPTEDFYLRRLAELANESQIKFFYVTLPVADSQYVEQTAEHFKRRNAHMKQVLSSVPGAEQIPLPATLSREHFLDFTHMVREGADIVRSMAEPYLIKACGRHRRGKNAED
jgi:hypothetical protein